jgi:uncharacterized OB-fold protein
VANCPSCGRENPPGSRFCNSCGAPLTEPEIPSREYRKVVTLLFCDVAGSTALGESVDPEALRALLGRYFDEMKAIVERVPLAGTPSVTIEVNDISSDPDLESRYGLEIPVLLVNGKKAAKYRVSEEELRRILTARAG